MSLCQLILHYLYLLMRLSHIYKKQVSFSNQISIEGFLSVKGVVAAVEFLPHSVKVVVDTSWRSLLLVIFF